MTKTTSASHDRSRLPRSRRQLLDQTLVKVDAESYRHYLDILDRPPGGEGFDRLMKAPKPWQG